MAVAMPIGGRYTTRWGRDSYRPRLSRQLHPFFLLSLLSLDAGYRDIFFPQVLQGIGFGSIFVALSTAVLSTIEKPLLTAAAVFIT